MRPTSTMAVEDEFRYGWRFVKRGEDLVQVPLTLEDCLHPQEDDHISVNMEHHDDAGYLHAVFSARPLAPSHAVVSSDLLIDWGVPKIRNHSPDVAVFVGLNAVPERKTGLLHLKQFAGRCELIVEVVSPSTRVNDVVHKLGEYHTVEVRFYVIIDQEREDGPRSLRAFRWTQAQYVEVPPDAQGRILLPVVNLRLGLRDDRAVCFDAATGEELADYSGVVQALEQADRRFEQQSQAMEDQVTARQDAERRESEALKLAERAQKDAERAQKDVETERLAREKADELVRDLRETLRRLQAAANPPADPAG